MMEYKGYIGKVEIDDELGILYGEVINVRDVITFEGTSVEEVQQAFQLLQDHGTHLGGVHFELTADKVTECVGGQCGLQEQDLHRAYKSLVDPRLNYEQALEIVARIVECATGRKEVALI